MADSLADMQNTAQGNTLGDIKDNTGAAPTSIGTAQSLGATQNASQMVGTPQQQQAAIKEALAPKSTLAELQRTATGRVQAKKGQSTSALEAVETAKTLTGLAGKIGEATTNVVSNAKVPLDLSENIDAIIPAGKDPTEVKGAFTNLLTTLRDGGDSMSAYKKLKELGYNDQSIAQAFNVSPDQLWGKVEASLPTNVKVSDIPLEPHQQRALTNAFPDKTPEEIAKLTWQEAKSGINQYLNNSMTNVSDLERQANDKTLPASTRAAAVQRLRELGVTGEQQAAGQIRELQDITESKDNIYIDGQAYEVQDVLQSPEAKALITDVLSGAKPLDSLKGTPFEGMTELIRTRAGDLAKLFGIKDGQLGAEVGALQNLEVQRNKAAGDFNKFLVDNGFVGFKATDNVMKAFGLTEDMVNGYTKFDQATLANSPVFKAVQSLPQAERNAAMHVLNNPAAGDILNSKEGAPLLGLLTTTGGRDTLNGLMAVRNINPNTFTNNEDDTKQIFETLGLSGLFDDVKQLAGINVAEFGGKIPDLLDVNKDGQIDDSATIEKSMAGANMDKLNEFKKQVEGAKLGDAVRDSAAYKTLVTGTSSLLDTPGSDKSWTINNYNAMLRRLGELPMSAGFTVGDNGVANIPDNPTKLQLAAIDSYNKLRSRIQDIDAQRQQEVPVVEKLKEGIPWTNKHGITESISGYMRTLSRLADTTQNPILRKQLLAKINEAWSGLVGAPKSPTQQQFFNTWAKGLGFLASPEYKSALDKKFGNGG